MVHVLDDDVPFTVTRTTKPVANGVEGNAHRGGDLVVGGGLSAAQTALRLVAAGGRVTLLHRHALRVEQWDADPGWLGPKEMDGFRAIEDRDRRRGVLDAARHRGTMTPEIFRDVCHAERSGRLKVVNGVIVAARPPVDAGGHPGAELSLSLAGDPSRVHRLHPGRIILATGFQCGRPGVGWLEELVHAARLPVASCGYPIPGDSLEWAPGLHVSGALAELELGPSARNVSGARVAARRILGIASGWGPPGPLDSPYTVPSVA